VLGRPSKYAPKLDAYCAKQEGTTLPGALAALAAHMDVSCAASPLSKLAGSFMSTPMSCSSCWYDCVHLELMGCPFGAAFTHRVKYCAAAPGFLAAAVTFVMLMFVDAINTAP